MRTIIISATENWLIPDLDVVIPMFDLYFQHNKESAVDGEISTLSISGKTYKAPFYNGIAKFYLDENLRFQARKEPKKLSVTLGGTSYDFYLWNGINQDARRLPAIFFDTSLNFPLSFIPHADAAYFNISDGIVINNYSLNDRLLNINIENFIDKEYLRVWFSKTMPKIVSPFAKLVPIRNICDSDVIVSFLLLSGEMRTYFLHEKRQVATFNQTEDFNKQIGVSSKHDFKTYQISDGQNKLTRTLYLNDLTTEQINELNQLAVSRHIEVDGVQVNVSRKQVEIKREENGLFNFFIEVEKPI